jgi:hypothetical protein
LRINPKWWLHTLLQQRPAWSSIRSKVELPAMTSVTDNRMWLGSGNLNDMSEWEETIPRGGFERRLLHSHRIRQRKTSPKACSLWRGSLWSSVLAWGLSRSEYITLPVWLLRPIERLVAQSTPKPRNRRRTPDPEVDCRNKA